MSQKQAVEEQTQDVDFETKNYEIKLHTNYGDIRLTLMPEVAPAHCRNMIGLAKSGFYNDLSFHRIIEGFMIQGGCPEGTGMGGPGFNIDAEFNDTPHEEGVLSMARSADPNSAGSQFFICLGKHTHLDNQYTAFGQTADDASMSVVRKIGSVTTDSGDRPEEPVVLQKAEVVETEK